MNLISSVCLIFTRDQFSQFSRSVVSNSLRSHGLRHARLSCSSLSPEVCSNLCHWVSDAIQPSHSLSPSSPPAFNLSQHQSFFQWVSSSHQVLELQLQHVLPMSIQGLFPWVISTWWASCDSDLRYIQVRRGSPNYPPKACLFWFLKGTILYLVIHCLPLSFLRQSLHPYILCTL